MGRAVGEAVGRASTLAGLIRAHRDFSEQNARAAPEVVDACRQAGLFVMAAPKEVGGLEATLAEQFEVQAIIAAADPGVAWCTMNSTACARAGAWIDPEYWPDVYDTPGTFGFGLPPTGTLTPTRGGYMLSGAWPLMTGVLDARWAAVNARVDGADPPAMRQAVIPTEALEVERIWDDAVAMRSSGSHRVSLPEPVFVPTGLIVDRALPARIDRPLYRHSTTASLSGAVTGVAVGLLESGIAAAAGELRDKVSRTTGLQAAGSAPVLELMADALVAASQLRLGAKAALDLAWEHLERDELPPVELRAVISGAPFHAIDVARDLISRLYARASSAAFFGGHPLERVLRDVHAVAYGIDTLRPTHHDVGRVSLGLDPMTPTF